MHASSFLMQVLLLVAQCGISCLNYFLLKETIHPPSCTKQAFIILHAAIETLSKELYPIESCDPFVPVDFHQRIHHPPVLLPRRIGAVLQNEAGFGDPDWIGQGKRHRP